LVGKYLSERVPLLSQQAEMVRKKDAELQKLRKDIELLTIQYEGQEASMRKKHQEAMNDLSDQVDYLSKTKNRYASLWYMYKHVTVGIVLV